MRFCLLAFVFLLRVLPAAADNTAVIDGALHAMLTDDEATQRQAIAKLVRLKDRGAVAPLVHMLFWVPAEDHRPLVSALTALTGARPGADWIAWMTWLQEHPEFVPYAGYPALLTELLAGLDGNFRRFIRADVAHEIRLEEIVWGGVKVDGIPALDAPKMVAASDAAYLNDDDRVFGVEIGGDARAYPLRIANWHEMINDTVGGVPVSLAYCTLCGAGVLFDGRIEGRPPMTFGSSGLLYRSNKLMYDRATNSLWNQFTGRPVVGPLVGSGIALKPLPVAIMNWSTWRKLHPGTTVLSLETGFRRDYGPNVAYRDYFASPKLLFPVGVRDHRLRDKDLVFGVRAPGGVKAWPLTRFAGGAVVNDRVGLLDVVLVGNAGERTVRAYESGGRRFAAAGDGVLRVGEERWTIGEAGLTGPDGRTLARLPGHVAYWFAWAGYFPETAALPAK